MPNTNKYREAFSEKPNLIGMTVIVALSAAIPSPVPLLIGLVAEAAYLLFVPDSSWYGRILNFRGAVAQQKRRQSMRSDVLPTLTPDLRDRYQRLEKMRSQVGAQTVEGQDWFSEAPQKFDYLLDKFLVFASKQTQFTQYLMSVHDEVCGAPSPPPAKRRDVFAVTAKPNAAALGQDHAGQSSTDSPGNTAALNASDPRLQQVINDIQEKYTQEQQQVTNLLTSEGDDNTKAVLQKRLEILKRRAEFLTKITKTLVNLSHQLQLLEDTFGLINDEIRARSPEQVLADIDDVITQTDTMTKVLEDLAPYEQMVNRMGASAQQSI